tara:strand:+ start:231 stop:488 length:258 start_codon:yes stop_codon:yes gene_type:complete
MQKIINVLALGSFAVSAAVVGAGAYVYINQDAIVDGIKEQATSMITDAVGGAVGDIPNLLGGDSTTGGSDSPLPGIGSPGAVLPF